MSNVFEVVQGKRKSWQPIYPSQNESCTEGAEETLSKSLAMRFLELPVREFIRDGLSREEAKALGQEGIACLERNMEDEDRHDIAFNNCVSIASYYNSKFEKEAKLILKVLMEHPDHPLVKVATIENGIFFLILPFHRQWGGPALRTTAIDVSADEVNHVQSHRYACKLMGAKPSKSLDNLRKEIVDWILQGFAVPGYDKETLRKASDNLMYKGIAPELNFTQSYQVHAFFEKRNDQLPYYTLAS